jgi:hypothetical protein
MDDNDTAVDGHSIDAVMDIGEEVGGNGGEDCVRWRWGRRNDGGRRCVRAAVYDKDGGA